MVNEQLSAIKQAIKNNGYTSMKQVVGKTIHGEYKSSILKTFEGKIVKGIYIKTRSPLDIGNSDTATEKVKKILNDLLKIDGTFHIKTAQRGEYYELRSNDYVIELTVREYPKFSRRLNMEDYEVEYFVVTMKKNK